MLQRLASQRLSGTGSFTIGLATPFSICSLAAVTDVAQGLTWQYSFSSNSWSPSEPKVRPGASNLKIMFQVRNISSSGNVTLTIKDDTGAILKTETLAIGSVGSPTEYKQTECTVAMPDRAYGITVSVTP